MPRDKGCLSRTNRVFVAGFLLLVSSGATTQALAQTPTAPPRKPDSARIKAQQAAEEERLHTDWPNLQKFARANAELPPPTAGEERVVFMGHSIFEVWARHFSTMFPGKPYINRGMGGQTTPQMLVRFRQDVIALKPKVVVILAGTNDVAGNTGPATLEMIDPHNAAAIQEALRQ